MNEEDINDYVPSILNPRGVRKLNCDGSLTQASFISRSSLSLRRHRASKSGLTPKSKLPQVNKENSQNVRNVNPPTIPKLKSNEKKIVKDSSGYSATEDIPKVDNDCNDVNLENASEIPHNKIQPKPLSVKNKKKERILSVSSHTDLYRPLDATSDSTIYISDDENPTILISFGVDQIEDLNITSKKSNIKSIRFSRNDEHTLVDCVIQEDSKASSESDLEENMSVNEPLTPNSLKRSGITVNLEIKRKKPSIETAENAKVLILNTSAVEKISHVIVQPPNYKLIHEKISDQSKIKSVSKTTPFRLNCNNGVANGRLTQKHIDSFFSKRCKVLDKGSPEGSELSKLAEANNDYKEEMSKKSGVAEKSGHRSSCLVNNKGGDNEATTLSARPTSCKKFNSRLPESSCSSPVGGKNDAGNLSARRNDFQFSIPSKTVSGRKPSSAKAIPHHKIVSGTQFAVDAFSYGDIQNVKHYFLTHFHSDHYSGLKKTFNKQLFCSKITADLCTSRIGVSSKCIRILEIDETIKVDDVEVTAVEANHCPGAIMLVFTLPNGKTLLHTGDFRASCMMESYPVFWNKDIHTIYLDTTYCNPRYDFPTQEQSLEMALFILRQKKQTLEQAGKKFSSVLIVCGTYTIGKEKFFLGMARRVGCTVWACPEKDRVLQAVEGRSFCQAPPHACQLHVVPMRDLTHEKLRSYLDSLKGAFTEVVAFKPSGWENTKNVVVEKDLVTIHGIPYSEHSSFSELIRFVTFLKPKQVVPTVEISGGIRTVQKYFPCPLVKEELYCQSKLSDFFSIQNRQQVPAVT